GVAIPAMGPDAVAEEIEKTFRDLRGVRRAHPDGPCHALTQRNAFMRDARRKVEHVSRSQHPFLRGREATQDPDVEAGDERMVALTRDPPAALSAALHEEHIVRIDVWTHSSPIGRVA